MLLRVVETPPRVPTAWKTNVYCRCVSEPNERRQNQTPSSHLGDVRGHDGQAVAFLEARVAQLLCNTSDHGPEFPKLVGSASGSIDDGCLLSQIHPVHLLHEHVRDRDIGDVHIWKLGLVDVRSGRSKASYSPGDEGAAEEVETGDAEHL